MSAKRYKEEFKVEAIKQVTDRDDSAPEVAGQFRSAIGQPFSVPIAQSLLG